MLFLSFKSASQNKEISVKSDNDAYLLQGYDGYYTNGLYIALRFPSKRDSKLLTSLGLGQEIFTPGFRDYLDSSTVDRPYAGHLYVWLLKTKFYHPKKLYFLKLQTGVIGHSSFGKEVQNWLHRRINLGETIGWEYQIPNMLSCAISGGWAQEINTINVRKNIFKIIIHSDATAGTTYLKAKTGSYFIVGRINNISSSSLFDARCLSNEKIGREFYFYLHPTLTWQGYDATIQGSWIKPPVVGITRDLTPIIFSQAVGIVYAKKRMSTSLEIIHQSRATTKQFRSHTYGSITIAHRWQ